MVINIKNLVSVLVLVRYKYLTAVRMMIQAYCLILKMQAQCSLTIYQLTQQNIPENLKLPQFWILFLSKILWTLHLNDWFPRRRLQVHSPDNENIIWHNKWDTVFLWMFVKFIYILSGWVTIRTFMRLHAAVKTSSALQAIICTTSYNPPPYITCSSNRNYNTVSQLCIWKGHLH